MAGRGRGKQYPYPQIPAVVGGEYAYHQIPAVVVGGEYAYHQIQAVVVGGEYPYHQIQAGGRGGECPYPQTPPGRRGEYPYPQTPAVLGGGGGIYPYPQIPPERGEYLYPQTPPGRREYPYPQTPAVLGGGGGRYPSPQIPPEGGECPYPQISAGGRTYPYPHNPGGGRGGENPNTQATAGGRGGRYPYPQIPGGGGGGEYLLPQIPARGTGGGNSIPQIHPSREKRYVSETVTWYKIPIYEESWRKSAEKEFDQETCHQLEKAYHQKLNEVSFNDEDSGCSYTASLDRYVLYLTGNPLPVAHLKRVQNEADRGRNTGLDRNLSPEEMKELYNAKREQMMLEQYKDKASQLVDQLKDVTNQIMQKEFPTNIEDIKSELAEIGRIQTEDIPIWAERKEALSRIYRDLQEKLDKEEQEQWNKLHSRVQEVYRILLDTSFQRCTWLQSLLDFIQKAVQVLDFLQKKIEEIYNCCPELDMSSEQIYMDVSQEMENQEACFISVQDHGHSLARQKHPARIKIGAYISEMLSKWSWLRELLNCLHQHIQGICAYNRVLQEAQFCEQWINRQTGSVNNCMSKLGKIPFENLEEMNTHCQGLQNDLAEYEKRVALLAKTSHDIIPLKQRNHQVISPVKVHCLCTYEQPSMSLKLHEECSLLDTSQKICWLVKNSRGQQDMVPSICLMISPPKFEAIALADRLKALLEQLKTLVKTYDRKLTENVVMTNIEFIRTWDLGQFQSLGPTKCKVLLGHLNDMADKLEAEAVDADQKMQKQMKKDLDECSRKVQEFSKKLHDEARTVATEFSSKEVKLTVSQSQEMKSKQMRIQPNTQDHPQTAKNDMTKKLKAVQGSGDPLIIPSVFGSGSVTVNPGVVRYLNASHVLYDRLKALEEQYGLKSQRNGYVLKLSGQADDLLSSANMLLHGSKKVPNEDRETKMPHKCQAEFLNAWKNREVERSSASEPDKKDVPHSFPSKKDLSQVYMEYKTEVAEDVLNSIKITYGQKGIDSLISELDQFAIVEIYQGKVFVHCDYKHAENVEKCVKSHYYKATKEGKTSEENKHLIQGGNDNHIDWLQFAYGHTSWSKNLQLEGGKLYLTGSLQMKREVEKAVHSMSYWYKEEFALTSEEQQKASEVVTLIKSAFPSVFIKRTRETLIVLSENSDNFERAKYKANEALGRIKITGRGKGHTDLQPHSESLSGKTVTDNKTGASRKCLSSGFQKNQPAAVLTPKSYYTKEGLTAKVYLGNITGLPVDCVVVAETGFLWHGVGAGKVISKAAGKDFDQEGVAHIRKYGAVPVTQCCVTSAGRLPYKAVIHAVEPKWSDYKDDEKERYIDDLIKTTVNCLIEANKLKLVSVAILPFSSGIFGVPKQLCAQTYAKGVIEYSKISGLQSVKEIHFVDTVSEMCQLTQSAFDKELQSS